MWDSFLNRTSQSCTGFNTPYYKKKTDLYSDEYKHYIHKDVLMSYLDTKKKSKLQPKKRDSKSANVKPKISPPVYFNLDKDARPLSSPACRRTNETCRCDKKCDIKESPEAGLLSPKIISLKILEKKISEKKTDDSKFDIKKHAETRSSPLKSVEIEDPEAKHVSSVLERQPTERTILSFKSSLYQSKSEAGTIERKPTSNSEHATYDLSTVNTSLHLHKPATAPVKEVSNKSVSSSSPSQPRFSLKVKKGICGCHSSSSEESKFPLIIYKYGDKGSGTRTRSGGVQEFYTLRDECLANGTLFEDPEFPATDSSLFFSQRPDRYYEWKRPNEIVDNPEFFVEGYSRFDVQQGELGDCWLLAAAANLTLFRRLFFQIVPDDQDFDDKYAGIFHFRFWQYGKWVDVVIDDRLPTYHGQLIFLHSTEENEFWSALLEKAYAKLHGSYEALKGGSTCEAMEDFTGGVTEMYEMDASPPNLFQIMIKAHERSSLMGCSIEPDPNIVEAETPEGLIRGHAYSITRVQYVDIQTPNVTGKIPLLRLRNPWGNESEWNGAWSDGAAEWRFISESEKEELGLTFDNDGEFWMSFKDFEKHFSRLEICNLNPDSLSAEELKEGHKKKWEMSVYDGEWVRGVTAGGCRNFLESFWHNPQYRITLTEVDDGDDECTMIIALMQKNRRHLRSTGGDLLTVGFAIYHLPYPDRVPKPLDVNFFKYNASVARSPSFINLREVSCRFKLPPGTYCIVPSTFDPNEEGEFLLRVFTEKENVMEQHDDEVGYGEVDEKIGIVSPYQATIEKTVCTGLVWRDHWDWLPHSPTGLLRLLRNSNVEVKEETPEDKEQTDKAYESFLNLAGEDGEVDWIELKEVLDYVMKTELQQGKSNATEQKKVQKGLNAVPTTQTQQTQGDDNFFSSLLSLICGTLCKDSPLAEVIPGPVQTAPAKTTLGGLIHGDCEGFSKDICRSMVAMLDSDRSGKLGYQEFKELWNDLRLWKNAWLGYDKDRSGTFSGFELREALCTAGYKVNSRILNILMHRYGNKSGQLHFDDFLMCSIKLKRMLDIFKEKDSAGTNSATFTMEEWLENTLYT